MKPAQNSARLEVNKVELHEIVMKLVGPVSPTGDRDEDRRRLENLRNLTELVELLLQQLKDVSHSVNRQELSMKVMGFHAKDFLDETLRQLRERYHPAIVLDDFGQRAHDFFADLDNGDGTFAFDPNDARDIDALAEAMLKGEK